MQTGLEDPVYPVSTVPAGGCKGGVVRFLFIRKREEMELCVLVGRMWTPLKKADGDLIAECWRKYMESRKYHVCVCMYTHNFYSKEFSSL